MSYTNGTTHYNLPQTTGSDKRDWTDANQAFADVDAALYGAVQDTAQAELDIDALETRMDTAELNIATNTGDISGLDTRVTTVEGAVTSLSGQVTDTRQDLEDMICAYNEASATSTHAYAIGDYFIYNDVLYRATQAIAIGNTIVPDTNCTTTNVTTELLESRSVTIKSVLCDGVTDIITYFNRLLDGVDFNFAKKKYSIVAYTGDMEPDTVPLIFHCDSGNSTGLLFFTATVTSNDSGYAYDIIHSFTHNVATPASSYYRIMQLAIDVNNNTLVPSSTDGNNVPLANRRLSLISEDL